jgi:hypothetical protein
MIQNMEQVKRFDFDLQFFAEPGGEPGTPPMDDGNANTNVDTSARQDQANTPSSGGMTQQQMVDWNTHQAALRGMNEAQKKASEYEKALNGRAIDQVLERAAYADAIDSDVPGAIRIALQKDRALAFQLYGELFGDQQQQQKQTSPYGDVSDYDEFGNRVESRTVEKVDQKYDPRLSKLENWVQQQYELGIKTKTNAMIPQEMQNAFWDQVAKFGIPIKTIEEYPLVVDGLIVQLSGGLTKYEESIRTAAQVQTAQNLTNKVKANANVATLTPGGGPPAVESPKVFTDPNERLTEALRRVGVQT